MAEILPRTRVALQLLAFPGMPNDFEQTLRDLFGEPLSRLSQFQGEQMQKLQAKLQELAREAIKEDLGKIHTEIIELRSRVAVLESERAQKAADGN
ncbi:MAG: hypothetical protein ABIP63_08320 [Thermoanaerobaculia bacterium]